MGGTITVVDNLTTESSSNALSAKQGKILNDKITAIDERVTALEENPSGSASNSVTRVWSE